MSGKIYLLAAALMMAAFPAFAQEETLLEQPFESGGFGGPLVRGTSFMGTAGLMVGGAGGWIINHTLVIGGAGSSLITEVETSILDGAGRPLRLDISTGGLKLDYIHNSDKLIHFTAGATIGAGSVGLREQDNAWPDYNSDTEYGSDAFFLLEPEVNVEINLTKMLRLDLGASYRYISGVNFRGLTDEHLRGFTGGILFKIGNF